MNESEAYVKLAAVAKSLLNALPDDEVALMTVDDFDDTVRHVTPPQVLVVPYKDTNEMDQEYSFNIEGPVRTT